MQDASLKGKQDGPLASQPQVLSNKEIPRDPVLNFITQTTTTKRRINSWNWIVKSPAPPLKLW